MRIPGLHKKPAPMPTHKRMLLTDPNSLIGYRINGGEIKLMSILGVGGHGVVYHAHEVPLDAPADTPPRDYAVKALSKVGLNRHQLQALATEFTLHDRVSDNEHIVTFHGIVEEPDFFFVLLDYIPDGDLFDMIDSRAVYAGNDELIKSVFVQLLDAVTYCHSQGVAHRDIKPENILCRDGGNEVVLADFGLATDRRVVREYGFGSEPYMAPQCFGGIWKNLGGYATPHTDVWSLGVVLVNLTCARNPWHKATDDSAIYRAFLHNPDHLLRILPISPALNAILRGTFAVNPHSRPSLADLRASILAVKSFTRDGIVPAPRPPVELTPGMPHTEVVRKITNLTTEDIARLESEARADARAAAQKEKAEAERARTLAEELEDQYHDERPLFLSPPASPTLTVVADMTPRARQVSTLSSGSSDCGPIVLQDFSDSDWYPDSDSDGYSDFSETESQGPITPASRAVTDADVACVPEISLDGEPEEVRISRGSSLGSKASLREENIPEATRTALREEWSL